MALQTLTGTHLLGSGAPSAGRYVKATPIPGQHVDATTVDTEAVVVQALTGQDGAWSLVLIQGVIYEIKIERWGVQTIQITADAEKAFTAYLGENALLGGTVPGSLKFETGESVVFFLFQAEDGSYQLGWRVVA